MPHEESWLAELQVDAVEEPQNEIDRADASRSVRAAIDRLPTRQRELLLMHMEQDLTYKQIAQLRGLSYRVVVQDLTRAYSTLRMQCLGEGL